MGVRMRRTAWRRGSGLVLPIVVLIGLVTVPPMASATTRDAALPGPPAAVQWREAAGIADMAVYQPAALFGLVATVPYVSVTTVSATPHCQFLDTTYKHGKAQLFVDEVLNYRQCGNLGDVRVLHHVAVGPFLATIYGCGSCAHPTPILIAWFAHATFIELNWSAMNVNTVIDVARDMRLVHKPAAIRASAAKGATEQTDASYVRAHNTGCAGYPNCPLVFQVTSDGKGGTLVAVDLLAVGTNACSAFGVAYFFDGTTYLASTNSLAPVAGVWSGGRPAWSDGARQFGVNYPVTPTKGLPCSEYGSLGVDTYVYQFNGTTMKVVTGTRPPAPQVLS
jgi:hypothetical protein